MTVTAQNNTRNPLALFSTTRRKFIGLAAAAGAAALAADSTLLEPNHPRIVRREIALRRWPDHLHGFTIALLSDFHFDPYFSVHPLHAAIPMVNDLHPDLILLTGDFVSVPVLNTSERDKPAAAAAEPCSLLLHQLQAPHGIWACLGNHDYYSDPDHIASVLRAQGIQVLINQSAPIEANGARFWLSGVNDILGEEADLDAALHDIPANEATILLAHEPDFADHVAQQRRVDLQLSGHTHGGQIRIPFLPPLYLPDLGKKYVWGEYRIGGLTLYTNRGIGTFGLPVRWNCPPEITLLTMRRAVSS